MANQPNQKKKLLYLMRFFLEETDEFHPASMQQIIEYLAGWDITAERKSIYRDIEILKEFGLDIVRNANPAGYYIASRDFELPELKLLVDAVQASRFITEKKSAELIRKLEGLTSHGEAKQLQRQVITGGRVKTMNESIYYNVDIIHTAILNNRKISFQYFRWSIKKEMLLRRGGERYVISPWALSWDNENYYLLGYDEEAGIMKHYRVDRMLRLAEEEQERTGRKCFEAFDMSGFSRRTFGMFSGDEKTLTIRFEENLIGVVIDRFGKDVPVRPVDEGHFQARVTVAVSPQFFGWLTGLGAGVQILRPAEAAAEYQEYLRQILAGYGGEEAHS